VSNAAAYAQILVPDLTAVAIKKCAKSHRLSGLVHQNSIFLSKNQEICMKFSFGLFEKNFGGIWEPDVTSAKFQLIMENSN
jgi:hypothetical protein